MKNFNPAIFLASLGAGGIAVLPFILLQYTIPHGPGLITHAQVWSGDLSAIKTAFYLSIEAAMIAFAGAHILLTVWFGTRFASWIRDKGHRGIMDDQLRGNSVLAPVLSLLMTMNLFIGPIRYFLPSLSENFQALFLPALITWSALFAISMYLIASLISRNLKNTFNTSVIGFGWLLDVLLLFMLTVVGTGIAAMSQSVAISHTAGFLSMISGSMGAFLMLIKVTLVFRAHFDRPTLPEKGMLPSVLIVIPIATLAAISLFRFGHFLEKGFGFHLGPYFHLVTVGTLAFEIAYLALGLSVIWKYLRETHLREYFDSQWGLICPTVALGAMAPFAYSVAYPNAIFYSISVVSLVAAVLLYTEILVKFLRSNRGA